MPAAGRGRLLLLRHRASRRAGAAAVGEPRPGGVDRVRVQARHLAADEGQVRRQRIPGHRAAEIAVRRRHGPPQQAVGDQAADPRVEVLRVAVAGQVGRDAVEAHEVPDLAERRGQVPEPALLDQEREHRGGDGRGEDEEAGVRVGGAQAAPQLGQALVVVVVQVHARAEHLQVLEDLAGPKRLVHPLPEVADVAAVVVVELPDGREEAGRAGRGDQRAAQQLEAQQRAQHVARIAGPPEVGLGRLPLADHPVVAAEEVDAQHDEGRRAAVHLGEVVEVGPVLLRPHRVDRVVEQPPGREVVLVEVGGAAAAEEHGVEPARVGAQPVGLLRPLVEADLDPVERVLVGEEPQGIDQGVDAGDAAGAEQGRREQHGQVAAEGVGGGDGELRSLARRSAARARQVRNGYAQGYPRVLRAGFYLGGVPTWVELRRA